jgi:hypothetical protein
MQLSSRRETGASQISYFGASEFIREVESREAGANILAALSVLARAPHARLTVLSWIAATWHQC